MTVRAGRRHRRSRAGRRAARAGTKGGALAEALADAVWSERFGAVLFRSLSGGEVGDSAAPRLGDYLRVRHTRGEAELPAEGALVVSYGVDADRELSAYLGEALAGGYAEQNLQLAIREVGAVADMATHGLLGLGYVRPGLAPLYGRCDQSGELRANEEVILVEGGRGAILRSDESYGPVEPVAAYHGHAHVGEGPYFL